MKKSILFALSIILLGTNAHTPVQAQDLVYVAVDHVGLQIPENPAK